MQKIITAFLILTLMSCAAKTELSAVWESDDFKQKNKIGNILIVGITDSLHYKKVFERHLKELFIAKGIYAVAASDHIQTAGKIAEDHFLDHFSEQEVDAVLFSRFIGVDTTYTNYQDHDYNFPANYDQGFYRFYEEASDNVFSLPTRVQNQIINIEVNVYSGKEMRLIWTSISRIHNLKDPESVIQAHCEAIVEHMKAEGFLKQVSL